MGQSSTKDAAPDELTAQFDAEELKALRHAYAYLASPTTGKITRWAEPHYTPYTVELPRLGSSR